MTAYMASLEQVRARGFATLWPTHGPPIRQPEPFLAAYAAHRRARETQILTALQSGPARIGELVPKLYADVDPRLHPAAACSMLAHMIDLARRGLIRTDGAPAPESEYRLL
jgi:glyoxylase-like metal-dependent hydrolase (beta-lactamase superfamily II)